MTTQTDALPEGEDEVWVTRDGRSIRVCDLDEEHAKSILRMILRARRIREKRLKERQELLNEVLDDHHKWGKS